MSDSITFLVHTDAGTFETKSWKDSNLPSVSLVRTISCTTPRPTFLIASKPKRISLPTALKSAIESFTSGGNTWIPDLLASLR